MLILNILKKSSTLINNQKKNFSVFSKLKEYLRSGVQNSVSIFGSNIDPEKIKVEIEDRYKTKEMPKKIKRVPREVQFSEEESKMIEELPNQIISTKIQIFMKN